MERALQQEGGRLTDSSLDPAHRDLEEIWMTGEVDVDASTTESTTMEPAAAGTPISLTMCEAGKDAVS